MVFEVEINKDYGLADCSFRCWANLCLLCAQCGYFAGQSDRFADNVDM